MKKELIGAAVGAALAIWVAENCAASVLVTAYGARGDGITNDAGAFQAALNSGQEVHVPRGTYVLRNTVVLGPGASLIGENNPILLVGAGQTFVVNSSYDWVTVKGLRVDGQNQGADVFTFSNGTYEVKILDCNISNVHSAFVQSGDAQVGAIYCKDDLCSNLTGPAWSFTSGKGSGLWINDCTVVEAVPGQSALYAIGYGGIFVNDFNEYDYPNTPKIGGWSFAFYNCFSIELDTILLDGTTTGGFLFSNCFDIVGTKLDCWGVYGTGLDLIVSQRASFSGVITNYSESGSGLVLFGCQFVSVAGIQAIGNNSCGIVVCNGSSNDALSSVVTQYNAAEDVSVDSTCSQITLK